VESLKPLLSAKLAKETDLPKSCVFPSSFFAQFFIMYNPTSRKTMLPKISGVKYRKSKPVLIASVYQNMLNRTQTEIAENINPTR
jgi:hypothetical protein